MAKQTETRNIDGFQYECTQFPPEKALRVGTRLLKFVGPSLGTVLKDFNWSQGVQGLMDQDLSKIDFVGALATLTTNIEDGDLYVFFKDVCNSIVVYATEQGRLSGQLKDNIFDAHFSDKKGLSRMFKVVKFGLEVNFSNFFEDALGGAQSLQGEQTSTRVR